jgi:hypothetical protein
MREQQPPLDEQGVEPPLYSGRFRLYSAEELGQFPKVEWQPGLEGVLPKRELVELYGPGDSFKSFVALDWACHLSSAGHDALYVAAEGASGIQGRIEAWKIHHNITSLPCLKVMPTSLRMQEPGDVREFVDAIKSQLGTDRPVLVVIDTLARNFVGGNENSALDLGLFVDGAETVRNAFDCTVLVVHHSTKDGSSERGGESLRNASFAMYRFERGKDRLMVTVTCERMKDAEPPRAVVIRPEVVQLEDDDRSSLVTRWPYGTDLTPPIFDVTDEKEAKKRQKMVEEILHYLELHGSGNDRCSQTQVVKNVHGRDATIIGLLKELSLDLFSPVQIEKAGRSVSYYYAEVPLVADAG